MRELLTGSSIHTTVAAVDEPSHGGACHVYEVMSVPKEVGEPTQILLRVNFQKGPIKEHGVNGIHHEDLLCILIDRFEGFQRGEYSCPENDFVLTYLQGALSRLKDRTQRRTAAGIEGTSEKDPMCTDAQAKADEQQGRIFEQECAMAGAVKVFEGFAFACTACEHLCGSSEKLMCNRPECDRRAKVDEQKVIVNGDVSELDNSAGEVKEYVPGSPTAGECDDCDHQTTLDDTPHCPLDECEFKPIP